MSQVETAFIYNYILYFQNKRMTKSIFHRKCYFWKYTRSRFAKSLVVTVVLDWTTLCLVLGESRRNVARENIVVHSTGFMPLR